MSTKPDNNYRSIADRIDVRVINEVITPPLGTAGQYDDILKFSNVQYGLIDNCIINSDGGNREDGVDIMRYCKNLLFSHCRVGAGKKYAFTIKGGSDFIYLENVSITRRGGGWERVDIDIGNYSSTVPDAKTGIVFLRNVTALDGKPVRVRVGWADRVVVEGGNVEILRCQSLALKVYVWLMRKIGGGK